MNFAIIGCGHIAKRHAEAIALIPEACLVAVSDKVQETMEPYVKEYGVTAYTDYEQMLEDSDIDIVSICTPSGLHAKMAFNVARAGKHIVVEKPISLTLEDANAMIEASEAYGVKLAVVHPNRFRPAMMELKQILKRGLLGKISHVNATVRWNRNQAYYDQATWRGTKSLDGGVLMNQAIHNLDLLSWLLGDAEEVYGMSATRLRNIEAEDVALGLIRFTSGALGVVEAATTIYPKNLEESISIFGELGTIVVGGPTATKITHMSVQGMSQEEIAGILDRVQSNPLGKSGHHWILEDMIAAIREDRKPVVDGLEGRQALSLVLRLYRSAEQNMPIRSL